MIQSLIDKVDNSEVIRDQLGLILANETVSQQAKAVTAGKDPDLWKLRVYLERSNPWEVFLNDPADTSPVVNVWFDRESFNKSHGNVVSQQKAEGIFNVDIYGYGVATDETTGHTPSDKKAAFETQRAVRLVRNILMAGEYTYLDLPRGLVWRRWPQSIDFYQPTQGQNQRPVEHVLAGRLALEVEFNEFSPQYEGVTLEGVSVEVKQAESGQVLATIDFDYS